MKNLAFILLISASLNVLGQEINLSEQLNSNQITAVNRQISPYETLGVEMNAEKSNGLAILDAFSFTNGIIDLEIKGENVPGKSFVGLAFNVQNDSTYEAIYFRPFNFMAEEADKRSHMVQYIAHPNYTWDMLRKERTNEFEAALNEAPSPDDWFAARIEITEEKVLVYVNNEIKPVLEVSRLAKPESDKIALWTGFQSSGRFRNLVLSGK